VHPPEVYREFPNAEQDEMERRLADAWYNLKHDQTMFARTSDSRQITPQRLNLMAMRREIQTRVCLLLMLLVFGHGYAITQQEKEQQLNERFERLRKAENRPDAIRHENAIWQLWIKHPDPDATRKLQDAMNHRRAYEFTQALELLNELEQMHPEWAEVYNQRATVHFHLQDLEASLQDVYETLKREPRHFGSLAGRGVIRLSQGKAALGYQSILEAMKYHPYLQEEAFLPPALRPDKPGERE
jgi:tetratricopeptide (TPR) repeat protein